MASGKEKELSLGKPSPSHSRRGSNASSRCVAMEKEETLLRRTVSRDAAKGEIVKAAAEAADGLRKGFEERLESMRKQVEKAAEDEKTAKTANGLSEGALEEENAPLVAEQEDDSPCTDLILVIHGIGQQLAVQYEAMNFVSVLFLSPTLG